MIKLFSDVFEHGFPEDTWPENLPALSKDSINTQIRLAIETGDEVQ